MIDVLLEALGLKALPRKGWVRRQVARPESVAAHSWGVSWLVIALLPPGLDLRKALAYAVLHDLPEVRAGDWTPHDGVSRLAKAAAERSAMAGLCAGLARGAEVLATWEAYEAQADAEACFVRQLDRLDMALQAVRYTEDGTPDLLEFVESAAQVVSDPELVRLLGEARVRLIRAERGE